MPVRSCSRGIGQQAIAIIKDVAKQFELGVITLTVNKYNTNSIAAYETYGLKKQAQFALILATYMWWMII